ncbi:MAG: hypothetical protein ACRDQ5_20580, partial [Sciscionella sp.]
DDQMGIVWGGGDPTANPYTYDGMAYARARGITSSPLVLRHWQWDDGEYRLRVELMTMVPGRRCSTTAELREPLPLPEA